MKIRSILIVLIIAFGFVFTAVYGTQQKTPERVEYFKDGQKISEKDFQDNGKNGTKITYFPNGNKHTQSQWKDDKPEGKWITWNEKGNKIEEADFKEGKLHGRWITWYENRNKERLLEFQAGKTNGIAKWWHKNGKLKISGIYKNGGRDGEWLSWNPEGEKFSRKLYKDSKLVEEDKALKAKWQALSKPVLTVVTPRQFSKEKSYPLFIVLHRGYEGEEILKKIYRSERIAKNYILAFIRSSQVMEWGFYVWKDDVRLGRKDVKQMFDRLVKQYPIDTANIFIGGMSQDGMMSIDAALTKLIPIRGFIVFCPTRPDSFSEETVNEALGRGLRGTMIAGEKDSRFLPEAKEMGAIFEKLKFPVQLIIVPGMGHQLPDDLKKRIDMAIDYILGK